MLKPWIIRRLRAMGEWASALALSGCVVYPPYGPRYGYNDRRYPYLSRA